ncbi:hypothetical protein MOP89_02515 [Enterococcus gallinarum]|nr:hypothetical protein [Enterococcus gallinarum]
MKKEIDLLVTVLAIGALAGCDTKNNTDKSESTHSSTHTSTTISSESSSSSSEAASSSAAQTSSKTVTQAGTLDQLSAAFPQDRLPSEVPLTEQKTLNAATDEGTDQLSILYYQLNDQRELNDPSLNNETPIASYKNAAYENEDQAAEAVHANLDEGGQAVDLGHNITGHMQGAAGSSYLSWQEGNWNLTVRAVNQENQDPVPVAKKIVAYLEEAMLPAPGIGQITIDMGKSDYTANSVSWQDSKITYTLQHQDPLSALKMAVSMNQ